MSGGLVLRLRPNERVIVNGVVLENGDRRTSLCVKTPDANILRFRDAMHPDEADTPVKRLYYVAQLVVIGEATPDDARGELEDGLDALEVALGDAGGADDLTAARAHLAEGRFYHVMRAMNRLVPLEAQLLLVAKTRPLREPEEAEAS
ncbi:MAG: flagellar biosynthesis repressor FlbT [Pseudomonadota bacterium]